MSVFGFKTPIPYPFGVERTGYLVTDIDAAIREARATGADVLVVPFDDPVGKDTIIQFPGGVTTQLYWHTTPPSYTPLQTMPENRVYVSADRAEAFIRSFLAFSHGKIVSDEAHAPGVEIGRPSDAYRRISIESRFGKLTALAVNRAKKRGYLNDGGGLYLLVGPTGAKSWVFRFRDGAKLREHGLGPLHTIGLAEAREKARTCRHMRLDGVDPIEARRAARVKTKLDVATVTTFKDCA